MTSTAAHRRAAHVAMAISDVVDFIKRELNATNPAVREANAILLRSAAMFVASVVFMRNFGELLAV